jgi:flagellar hook-length control protein FliK
VRDAVTGTDPQPAQPAADPRVVSAAAPDAQSATQPQAFSLQAISDTSGSYSATGASTTAGSNLSKAAVESLSALSMQIHKKLEQGSTKFAIELHPADLGKVEVSLHIGRDGKTTAHLTFDSPVTAASFSASEPELRQQLADAGVSLDKDSLSFSSREGSSQGGSGGFGSALAQDQQQSQARHAARALQAANKVADESDLNAVLDTAVSAMRRGVSTLALNLIV